MEVNDSKTIHFLYPSEILCYEKKKLTVSLKGKQIVKQTDS